MTKAPEIQRVLHAQALNGERPAWSVSRQRLFWVDLRAPALHLFDPGTGHDEAWEMPCWIGCYGLTASGAVVALRTGLYLFELDTGALRFLATSPFDIRRFIFNDGRCDRQGRFLAGTMYVPLKPGEAEKGTTKRTPLWRYEGNGAFAPVAEATQTSNGLAWSPDGRTMYHSGTKEKTIWAHDYDPDTGAISNRRVFATVEMQGQGGPDGATVDRDGFYWSCIFGGGRVLRFDPDGRLERTIEMPVKHPSMPAFGGPNLDTVFVTSANWPLSPEERKHSVEGDLFAFQAPVPGLPETEFRMPGGA